MNERSNRQKKHQLLYRVYSLHVGRLISRILGLGVHFDQCKSEFSCLLNHLFSLSCRTRDRGGGCKSKKSAYTPPQGGCQTPPPGGQGTPVGVPSPPGGGVYRKNRKNPNRKNRKKRRTPPHRGGVRPPRRGVKGPPLGGCRNTNRKNQKNRNGKNRKNRRTPPHRGGVTPPPPGGHVGSWLFTTRRQS